MKKLLSVLVLLTLVTLGMSAQLMFGLTGALHMDSKLGADVIADKMQKGEGVWYGAFGELAFDNLGFGLSGNFTRDYEDSFTGAKFYDLDVSGYVSYHLFGGHAFLDPILEAGMGYIGTDYTKDSPMPDPDEDNPLSASMYWYGALGLGVNLGDIGVFGKFAYNNKLNRPLEGKASDGTKYDIPAYGPVYYDETTGDIKIDSYVPNYRFTLGIKLIL